jgi:protocatechuate 3,4-dioxygenase beta subunit
MERRTMLRSLGAMGIASLFPLSKSGRARGAEARRHAATTCWLTPQETQGPYYFNADLLRQDIRTDVDTGTFHDGLPLQMTFRVIDFDCNPVANAIVDIWHADKDGVYSGYVQPGGNTVGQDFLRGMQVTNAAGECSFITSYPGWYPGRTPHIHFKVRLSSTTYVTSQFCFLDSVNAAVYATPLYAGRGSNPTTNATDGVFHNPDPAYLRMTTTPNATTGGYDGLFVIGIALPTDVGATGEPPGGFALEQNFPNPFNPSTTIRYTLAGAGHVELTVHDVLGRTVATLIDGMGDAGTHETVFDGSALASGFYLCRLASREGIRTREMLLLK